MNTKTDGYIGDVTILIDKIKKAKLDWDEFARGNDEKNRLSKQLQEAIDALLRDFELLKQKNAEGGDRCDAVAEVYTTMGASDDYTDKKKTI